MNQNNNDNNGDNKNHITIRTELSLIHYYEGIIYPFNQNLWG